MADLNYDQESPKPENIHAHNLFYLDIISIHEERYQAYKLKEYLWKKSQKAFALAPLLGATATLYLRGEEMNFSEKGVASVGAVATAMILASVAETKEKRAAQKQYDIAHDAARLSDNIGISRDAWIVEGLDRGSPEFGT